MKRVIFTVLALAAASIPGAACAADPQIAATIQKFIADFNKGDAAGAASTHLASGVSIIDEVPPYAWQGKDAFGAWANALMSNDKAAGISEEKVTLGAVKRELVTGSTAYVIMEATYSFKQKGLAMREPAQMTYALTRTAEGWKIAGWTWTGPDPKPAK